MFGAAVEVLFPGRWPGGDTHELISERSYWSSSLGLGDGLLLFRAGQ